MLRFNRSTVVCRAVTLPSKVVILFSTWSTWLATLLTLASRLVCSCTAHAGAVIKASVNSCYDGRTNFETYLLLERPLDWAQSFGFAPGRTSTDDGSLPSALCVCVCVSVCEQK